MFQEKLRYSELSVVVEFADCSVVIVVCNHIIRE
jgi:hypothetical protein